MNTSKSFYILALNMPSLVQDVSLLHQAQIHDYKEVIGYWNGEKERSYVIPTGGDSFGSMVSLALATGQDAFLLVENGYGFLYTAPDEFDTKHPLGQWKPLTLDACKDLNCYTIDPVSRQHYGIV